MWPYSRLPSGDIQDAVKCPPLKGGHFAFIPTDEFRLFTAVIGL